MLLLTEKGLFPSMKCLEKGPNLIEIIPTLLNRFRKYPIGVISDIEKAFLQIAIRENDRDFYVSCGRILAVIESKFTDIGEWYLG